MSVCLDLRGSKRQNWHWDEGNWKKYMETFLGEKTVICFWERKKKPAVDDIDGDCSNCCPGNRGDKYVQASPKVYSIVGPYIRNWSIPESRMVANCNFTNGIT